MKNYLNKRRRIIFLFILFFISVIIKLIVAYYLGNRFQPKLWEYEEIATNIINSKGFLYLWPDLKPIQRFNIQFRSIQEPFFPILCAVTYFFTHHSILAVLMLQILYTSLIPIIIFYIARKIYDSKTAILTVILSLFLPGITFYSAVNLHQMPLYSLFFCIILLLTLTLFEKFCLKNQILLGIVLGISLLTRSTTIFIMFFVLLWLWIFLKANRRTKILGFLNIVLIAGIIILPWVIRNSLIHKRLVLFQSSDGYFLYIATNPRATGTLYLSDGRFQLEAIPEELLKKYNTMTELQFKDLMLKEGWRYVRQDPIRIFKLASLRFFYFWWFSPITGKAPGFEYPKEYLKLYKAFYAILLFLFLSQVFCMVKEYLNKKNPSFSKEILVLLILLAISIPHIILYSEGRHKFSIEPLLLILASRRITLFIKALRFKPLRYFTCT